MRALLLALALLALPLPALARPALPPAPALVVAVPLGGDSWRVAWAQRSDAPRVRLAAPGYGADLTGAAQHAVTLPAWRPEWGVTITEDWPGTPAEIYPVAPRVLDRAVYLPAL